MTSKRNSGNLASLEASSSSSSTNSGENTRASSGKVGSSPSSSRTSNHKSLGEIWFHRMDTQGEGQVQQTDLKLSARRGASSLSPSSSTTNQSVTKKAQNRKRKEGNDSKDQNSKPSPNNQRAPLSSLSTSDSCESMSTYSATKERRSNARRRKSSCSTLGRTKTSEQTATKSDEVTPTNNNDNKRRKLLTDDKRKERNAREQGRSNKISDQFAELRELMVSSGIVVPKGTKGAVLSIVLEYIRVLQQNRVTTEAECQRMRQQLCSIRQGQCGPVAAKAVKAIARQNGVPSLTTGYWNTMEEAPGTGSIHSMAVHDITQHNDDEEAPYMLETRNDMKERQYQEVFDHGSVAMGIASLGGTFLDCNRLFCELSQYSKDQVRSLSIFNLTSREELSNAFDRLSGMLTADSSTAQPIVLQGSSPGQQLHIRLLDPDRSSHYAVDADDESFDQASDCRRKLLLVTLMQTPAVVGGAVASPLCLASVVGQQVPPVASMEKPEQGAANDDYQRSSTFYFSVA